MQRRRVISIIGTRPEVIKMAPVIRELNRRKPNFDHAVVATAQHREMLDQILKVFAIEPNVDLEKRAARGERSIRAHADGSTRIQSIAVKIRDTSLRNLTFLVLAFLVSISPWTRLGHASTRSDQILEALSSGNLATGEFLHARNFQSATAHFARSDEKKGWKQYTERKPDDAAIKLEIDGKLLNLNDDLNTIYAHYRNREKDSFL